MGNLSIEAFANACNTPLAGSAHQGSITRGLFETYCTYLQKQKKGSK